MKYIKSQTLKTLSLKIVKQRFLKGLKMSLYMPNNNELIVHNAFQVGRDPESIVAYHGTSLYVLNNLIETGRINGSGYSKKTKKVHLSIREGDVFILPIKNRSEYNGHDGTYDEKESFENALGYASSISSDHHLRTLLGLTINSRDINIHDKGEEFDFIEFFMDFNPNLREISHQYESLLPLLRYLLKRGFDNQAIKRMYSDAKKKKGVVLGFSNQIYKKGFPLQGNDGYDIRVQNVSIESLIGIEPLDQGSYDFLDTLRKSN